MSADAIVKADIDLAKILEAINSVGNTVASLTTTIKDHSERLKDVEGKVRALELNHVALQALEKDIKALCKGQNDLQDDIEAIRRSQTKLTNSVNASQTELTNSLNALQGKQDTNSFILQGSGKVVGWILSIVLTAFATWWISK